MFAPPPQKKIDLSLLSKYKQILANQDDPIKTEITHVHRINILLQIIYFLVLPWES